MKTILYLMMYAGCLGLGFAGCATTTTEPAASTTTTTTHSETVSHGGGYGRGY